MRYKNGREAKQGDMVAYLTDQFPRFGIVYGINKTAGQECAWIVPVPCEGTPFVDLKDCLTVADIIEVVKQAGLDVRETEAANAT